MGSSVQKLLFFVSTFLLLTSPGQAQATSLALTPVDGSVLEADELVLEGTVPAGSRLIIDGESIQVEDGRFLAGPYEASEGERRFLIVWEMDDGRRESFVHRLVVDRLAPSITLQQPIESRTRRASMPVEGVVIDPHLESLQLDGRPVAVDRDGRFRAMADLQEGSQTLTLTARDRLGHATTKQISVQLDTRPPEMTWTLNGASAADSLFNRPVEISATSADAESLELIVDGQSRGTSQGTMVGRISEEGSHQLEIIARDAAGNESRVAKTVTLDRAPPAFKSLERGSGKAIADEIFWVKGRVAGAAQVLVDGQPARLDGELFRAGPFPLAPGDRTFAIVATDDAGNAARTSLTVKSDPEAPVISITNPAEGSVFGSSPIAVSGSAVDADLASVTVNGNAATLDGSGWSVAAISLTEGANTLTAVATDGVGNTSNHSIQVILDTTAPVLGLTAGGSTLVDGSVFAEPITPEASTSDATQVQLTATLDGLPWSLGTTVDSLGGHQLEVTATDQGGNATTKLVTFTIEGAPPAFAEIMPADGEVTAQSSLVLQGRVGGAQSLTVDGVAVELVGEDFVAGPYTLTPGPRTFTLIATSPGGQTTQIQHSLILDDTAPVVTITSPGAPLTVSSSTLTVEGTVTDAHFQSLEVQGQSVTPTGEPASGAAWSRQIVLSQGENVIVARATDAAGTVGEAEIRVTLDDRGPRLEILEPEAGLQVSSASLEVHGRAFDANLDRVEIRGGTADVTAALDGSRFSATVDLPAGSTVLTVEAFDSQGHSTSSTVAVERDDALPILRFATPAVGTVTSAATVDASGEVAVGATVKVNGVDAVVTSSTWSITALSLDPGENVLTARATASDGSESVRRRTIVRDLDSPILSGVFPSNESIVDDQTTFILTFSEAMADPTAGSWRLETSTAQVLASTATFDPEAIDPEATLRITPNAALPAGEQLSLVLTDQLTDLAGHALAPITLTFYTDSDGAVAAPVITSTMPSAVCATGLQVSGTAVPGSTVETTGGVNTAQTIADDQGAFSLAVSLESNRLHRLETRAIDGGQRSAPVVHEVIQDCVPPSVIDAQLTGTASTSEVLTLSFDETVDAGSVQIQLSDSTGTLAGTLTVDGAQATWTATAALPVEVLRLELGAGLRDAAGNATDASYVQLFGGSGASTFLVGTVVDESTGRPLAGALVRITASNGIPSPDPAPEQTTGDDGRFQIAVPAGTHDLSFSRPGYSPVFRAATTTEGEGTDVFTPRLEPLQAASSIDPAGGRLDSERGCAFDVAAGLLAASSEITLTCLSEQALPYLLPYGWSPRASAWIDLGAAPDAAAVNLSTLELVPAAPAGTQLVAVYLDLAGLQWRVLEEVTAAGRTTLSLDPAVFAAGEGLASVVLVQADLGAAAPPQPVIGEVLGSAPTAAASEVGAAGLSFSPEMVLPTQTSDVTVTYDLASPQPSGIPLLVVVQEELELLDGTIRREAPYQAHLVLYHDASGQATSHFRLRPSESAQSRPIRLGAEAVSVLRYTDESVRGNVLGPDGGSVVGDSGDVLSVPSGALSEPTAITLERQTVGDLPLAAPRTGPGGGTVDVVIELDLADQVLNAPGALSIPVDPAPVAGDRGLLLHVVQIDGSWAYRAVAELAPSAAGWVTEPIGDPDVDPDALPWPGVREGGQYVALKLDFVPAFVRGTALDLDGAPLAGAVISTDAVDWIQISDDAGEFVLPVPEGTVELRIDDPAAGNQGTISLETTAETTHDLDPQVEVVGPSVVSTTPADGVEVPAGFNPQVSFSEAIDPTVADAGIRLSRNGETVPSTVSVSGSLLTVLPQATLTPGATYQLDVFSAVGGQGIRDLQGFGLERPVTVSFTVTEVELPNSIDLSKVHLFEPNAGGLARVLGQPGAVPAGNLVWVENLTSYQTTESTQAAQDGSFSIDIGATVEDEILFHVLVDGGNEVIKLLSPFWSDDRKAAWVGDSATEFTTVDGIQLTFEEGTFAEPTRVRVEPKSLATPPNPWPAPGVLQADYRLDLDLGGDALKPVDISVPAPAGAQDGWYVLAKAWHFFGEPLWSMKDIMVLDNGRLTTDPSAPAPGGGSSLVTGVDTLGEAQATKAGRAARATKAGNDPRDHTVRVQRSGDYSIFSSQAGVLAWVRIRANISWNVVFNDATPDMVIEALDARDYIQGRHEWVVPNILGQHFSLWGRDGRTGFETFREVFEPQTDPVEVLPAPTLTDRGVPYPLTNGSPFYLIGGNPGEKRTLAPGIEYEITNNQQGADGPLSPTQTLTVTFERDSLILLVDPSDKNKRLPRQVKIFSLNDQTETVKNIGKELETQAVTVSRTITVGDAYLLAVGPILQLGDTLEMRWNEALDEALEGFQLNAKIKPNEDSEPVDTDIPTHVEPISDYTRVKIRPESGFRAGERYVLKLQPKIKDVSGNFWLDSQCAGDQPSFPYSNPCATHGLELEIRVQGSALFDGFDFERVRDIERMGSLLFVAADERLWVLDATAPHDLKNYFATESLALSFPGGGQIRGLAFDPHGRLMVAGGGVADPGQVKIFDPLLIEPTMTTETQAAVAWRGSTLVSNQLGADSQFAGMPAGSPSRMEILSRDESLIWTVGSPKPSGYQIQPNEIPSLREFDLTIAGSNGVKGYPVTVKNLTRGTWARKDAGSGGAYTVTLKARHGDQIQVLRNFDSLAYVQIDEKGLAAVDLNHFYGETLDNPSSAQSQVLRYLREIELSHEPGDKLCNPDALYLKTLDNMGNLDLGLLGRGTDGPWHIPVLIRAFGLVMLEVHNNNPVWLSPVGMRCGVSTSATPNPDDIGVMSGMVVIEDFDARVIYDDNAVIPVPENAQTENVAGQEVKVGREQRDYVVMGNTQGWILVVDVSKRTDPRVVAKIELPKIGTPSKQVIAGPMTFDRQGRRLLISAYDQGLWVVDFDSPYPLKAIDATTAAKPDVDNDTRDDRILDHVEVVDRVTSEAVNLNRPTYLWEDLGLAFLGGRFAPPNPSDPDPGPPSDQGLQGWIFGAPRISFMGTVDDGLVALDQIAPFGAPTADIPGLADSEYPGVIRIEMALPGDFADTGGVYTLDLLATGPEGGRFPGSGSFADGDLAKLPSTALLGDDALELRRQSDNPRDPGYNLFVSEPIVVLADLKASYYYQMSDDEKNAKDSFDKKLCERCDLVEEGIYPASGVNSTLLYREMLSGYRLTARFSEALHADLLLLYDPWHLKSAEAHVTSVPWDVSPSITQEPFNGANYGHGSAAPGTVLHSGEFTHGATDLVVPAVGFDLGATRAYRNQTVGSGSFGPGWDLAQRKRLRVLPNKDVQFFDGTGRRATFEWEGGEFKFKADAGLFVNLSKTAAGYQMVDRQGNVSEFDFFGRLTAVADNFKDGPGRGNLLEYRYDSSSRLISLTAHDRSIYFDYEGSETENPEKMGRIAQVRDELPGLTRVVDYSYDENGRLESVESPEVELSTDDTTPERLVTEYTYDTTESAAGLARALHRLDNLAKLKQPSTVDVSADAETWLELTYEADSFGYGSRVLTQKLAGDEIKLRYVKTGNEVTTTVTDRRGNDHIYAHLATGQMDFYKDPEEHVTRIEYGAYDREHGLPTKITLPTQLRTLYSYAKDGSDTGSIRIPPVTLPNVANVTQKPGLAVTPLGQGACQTDGRLNGSSEQLQTVYQGHNARTQVPLGTTSATGEQTFAQEAPGGQWIEAYRKVIQTGVDGSVSQESSVHFDYDELGRVLEQRSQRSDAEELTTTFNYGADSGALALGPEIVRVEGTEQTLETQYTYNVLGQPLQITEPGNTIRTFEYNALGWPLKECVRYQADVDNTLFEPCTEYVYDRLGRVIETKIPFGNGGSHTQATAEFGLLGQVLNTTLEKEPGGAKVEEVRTYDKNLNLKTLKTTSRFLESFEYDNRNLPKERKVGSGAQETVEKFVYDKDGRLLETKVLLEAEGEDEQYLIWRTQFDAYGRTMLELDPLNRATRTSYTPDGRPAFTTACNSAGEKLASTEVITDQAGRVVQSERVDPKGELASEISQIEYDSDSNVVKTIDPHGTEIQNVYDDFGRLVLTKVEGGAISEVAYSNFDDRGNAQTVITSYPQIGDNPAAYTETLLYNGLDQPIRRTNGLNQSVEHRYDVRGNVLSIKDPLHQITSFTYDGLDRPLTQVQPEGITVTTEYVDGETTSEVRYIDAANQTTTSEVDGFGRLVKVTYPDSRFESFEYDKAHRRTKTIALDGTQLVETFDGASRPATRTITPASGLVSHTSESLTFDALDNLTKITQGPHTTDLDYDDLSRLRAVTTNGKVVSHALSAAGLPEDTTYPSSLKLINGWDPAGRLDSITTQGGMGDGLLVNYQWQGPMTASKTLANVTGAWTRDAGGRVERAEFFGPSDVTQLDEILTRDARGMATGQRFDDRGGFGWTREFDDAGRLTSADAARFGEDGQPTAVSTGQTLRPSSFDFTLNAVQSLTQTQFVGACGGTETILYPDDGSGRHRPSSVGDEALVWNDAGNLERKGDLKFSYDYLNRLTQVEKLDGDGNVTGTVATYTYDGLNRRVRRNVGPDLYETAWNGWQAIEEYKNAQLIRRQVYGPGLDEIVALENLTPGGTAGIYTPLYDQAGHVRVMVDSAGKPVERYDYSPHGERYVWTDDTAPSVHQVRFEAGEFIVEVSEMLDMVPVEAAINDTLVVRNLTQSIDIPVSLSTPVEDGPMALRRWVLTPQPEEPEHLVADDDLELTIPKEILEDFFGNKAGLNVVVSGAIYGSTDGLLLHDTAPPKLEHACIQGSQLRLTFSETPNMDTGPAEVLLNGATSAWTLDSDGYTLLRSTSGLTGEQTLTYGTNPFDLAAKPIQSAPVTFASDATHLFPDSVHTSTIGNPYGFKGLPIDEETGLIYVRNRYYDPQMGRFIQTDPLGYVDGPNLYKFAANNPVTYGDPLGLYDDATADMHAEAWNNLTLDQQEQFTQVQEAAVTTAAYAVAGTAAMVGSGGTAAAGLAGIWGLNSYSRYQEMGGGDIGNALSLGLLDMTPISPVLELYHGYSLGNGQDLTGFQQAMNWVGVAPTLLRAGSAVNRFRRLPCKLSCFTAGTLIATEGGLRPIEEIAVGDRVWARNSGTGVNELAMVVRLFQREVGEYFEIRVGEDTFEVTGEHPFWVDGRGWVEAENLRVGDWLVTFDGELLQIEDKKTADSDAVVYNFEVEGLHNYFVGDERVLVHNCNRVTTITDANLVIQAVDWNNAMARAALASSGASFTRITRYEFTKLRALADGTTIRGRWSDVTKATRGQNQFVDTLNYRDVIERARAIREAFEPLGIKVKIKDSRQLASAMLHNAEILSVDSHLVYRARDLGLRAQYVDIHRLPGQGPTKKAINASNYQPRPVQLP